MDEADKALVGLIYWGMTVSMYMLCLYVCVHIYYLLNCVCVCVCVLYM